jgi:hypothetical protein
VYSTDRDRRYKCPQGLGHIAMLAVASRGPQQTEERRLSKMVPGDCHSPVPLLSVTMLQEKVETQLFK